MMMRTKWQRVGAMLDIPTDVTADVGRVTILGRAELSVENHSGIVEYGSEVLRLKIADGELRISGSSLVLTLVNVDELRVTGRITAVQYV